MAELRTVLLRGLQVSPAERFPTMAALLEALADEPWARCKKIHVASLVLLSLPATAFADASWQQSREQLCRGAAEQLASALAVVTAGPDREEPHDACRSHITSSST